MNDLVTWLRSVLDEDAQSIVPAESSYSRGGIDRTFSGGPYDPRHVVADIAAKRDLIGLAESAADRAARAKPATDEYTHMAKALAGMEAAALHDAIRRIASAYADRPGYQEEWRP